MEKKYILTEPANNIFLGIIEEEGENDERIYSRPQIMSGLFEEYLPNGFDGSPTMTIMKDSYGKNNVKNPNIDDKIVTKCRRLLGKLIQLIDVRFDIACAISKIAQNVSKADEEDYLALMRVVQYLYVNKDLKLRLHPNHDNAKQYIQLRAYCDAAYSVTLDGRSQYCYCFDLVARDLKDVENDDFNTKTGMFYLKSKLADSVDLGTCGAETGSAVEAIKDVILFRGILEELHLQQVVPTPVYNDNSAGIHLSSEYSGNHKKVRFMLPRINWLLEQTKAKIIKMKYMQTGQLPPDIGTKTTIRGVEYKNKVNRCMGNY
jgi:hypothetical protein